MATTLHRPDGSAAPPAQASAFSQDEILRYSRHLILPEVGMTGQRKLKDARVLLVGSGGLYTNCAN